jgi:hypothetical protein
MDVRLSRDEVLQVLREIDVDDYFSLADVMLDWLDAAATSHVDLGTLVIGHRQVRTMKPVDRRTVPAAYQPREHAAFLDQPYGAMVAAGFGSTASAAAAGVISARSTNPRERWRSRPAAA